MRPLLTIIFLLHIGLVKGQHFSYPAIIKEGQSIIDFIPKGWSIKDSVYGDFNNEKGYAIVTQKDDTVTILKMKEDVIQNVNTHPRILFILFRNKSLNQFQLVVQNNSIILTKDDPNMIDPYQQIEIKKGALFFKFTVYYGPSAYYLLSYAFRLQNQIFTLIGADNNYFNVATRDFQNCSFNFLTNKWSIAEGNDDAKRQPKRIWHKLNLRKMKTLKDFGQPNTWEVSKGIFL